MTSVSPGQTGRGKSATRSVMILGYISAAAAVLCNLSFIGPFDGWYAVSATVILGVVQFIPYWRDRQEGSGCGIVQVGADEGAITGRSLDRAGTPAAACGRVHFPRYKKLRVRAFGCGYCRRRN